MCKEGSALGQPPHRHAKGITIPGPNGEDCAVLLYRICERMSLRPLSHVRAKFAAAGLPAAFGVSIRFERLDRRPEPGRRGAEASFLVIFVRDGSSGPSVRSNRS